MKVMSLVSGISILMKETPESSLASSSTDRGRRGLSANQESRLSSDTESAGVLLSDHSLKD